MSVLSARPKGVEDVASRLSMYNVGEQAQWLGYNDNLFYRPYAPSRFISSHADGRVIGRRAFSVERSLSLNQRRVSDSRLGQAALMLDQRHGRSQVMLAVLVPTKEGLLSPTTEQLVAEPLPLTVDTAAPVEQLLEHHDGLIHRNIAQAIWDALQGPPVN